MENNEEKYSFVKETVIDKKSRAKRLIFRFMGNALIIIVACFMTMFLYDRFISKSDKNNKNKETTVDIESTTPMIETHEKEDESKEETKDTLSEEDIAENQIVNSVITLTKYYEDNLEPTKFTGVILSKKKDFLVLTQYQNIDDAIQIYGEIGEESGLNVTVREIYEEYGMAMLSVDVSTLSSQILESVASAPISYNSNPAVASHFYFYGEINGAGLTLSLGDVLSLGEENYIADTIYNKYMIDTKLSGVNEGFIFDTGGSLMAMSDFGDSENSKITVIDLASIRTLINSVVNKGYFTYTGIVGYMVNDQIASLVGEELPDGMYVTEVLQDSPAYEAGIMVGDIIYKMNTSSISSLRDIRRCIDGLTKDTEITIYLYRKLGNRYNTYTAQATLIAK